MNDCRVTIFFVKMGRQNDLVTKVFRRLRR